PNRARAQEPPLGERERRASAEPERPRNGRLLAPTPGPEDVPFRHRLAQRGREPRWPPKPTLWECERGCGAGSSKRYPNALEARATRRRSTARTVTTSAAGPGARHVPLRIYRSLKGPRR